MKDEEYLVDYPQGNNYENALTIGWTEEVIVDDKTIVYVNHYELLDIVSSKSITLSSTVTQYPIAASKSTDYKNDYVMDHKFDEPLTMTVSGKFSLRGRNANTDNEGLSRIKQKQELFEKIKSEAYLCTVTTVNKKQMIFKSRNNLCLSDITWNEETTDTVSFTFTFKEIRFANVEEVEYQQDVTDTGVPSITSAQKLDFTDTLLNMDDTIASLIKMGLDDGFIMDEFMTDAYNTAKGGKTFLFGTAVAASVLGVCAILGVVPGLGAAVVVIGFIAWGLCKLWDLLFDEEDKYRVQPFKHYDNEDQMNAELERFGEFIEDVKGQLEQLEDVVSVYGISYDGEQECLINIKNIYYYFTFTKVTGSSDYSLTIQKAISDVPETEPEIIWTGNCQPIGSIAECDDFNNLFSSVSGLWVYLVNTKLEDDSVSNEDKKKLTNCKIFVSPISMKKFNNLLADILKSTYLK